ncbi:hypothetical protein BH11PSE2_BH11PSE2_21750 [soil metagenome]
MTKRHFTICLLVGAMSAAMVPAMAADAPAAKAAPAKSASIPMTIWGTPDMSGTWTNASLTTLERPNDFGERLVLTPAEVAKLEGAEADARVKGNAPTDPKLKVTDLPVDCGRGFTGTNCGYNSGWVDPGSTVMRVAGQPRSSFITTTPNGKVPARKATAGAATGGPRPALRPGMQQNDNPETRSLGERCMMSFGNSSGPVMQPQLYNNNYEFIQTKDELAIWVEMVHDVRHIRLNTKEHLPANVRPWMGDSIGWWEGKTLVAETTNFPAGQNFRGSSANLKITERFTRTSPSTVLYQFKVEDPSVWDAAWGGEYEFSKQNGQVYEYACHEGNYALEGILAGARAEDDAAKNKVGAAAGARPAGLQQ